MVAKVYVGNLSWNTTDDVLALTFAPFGQLIDYIVMKDRETGRSRGFGFVTYATQDEADAAIQSLNEQQLDGRTIRVNMAHSRPRNDNPDHTSGFGYGGYAFGPSFTLNQGFGTNYPQGFDPAASYAPAPAPFGSFPAQAYGSPQTSLANQTFASPQAAFGAQAYPASQAGFGQYGFPPPL